MKTLFRALPLWLALGGLSWVLATATPADMMRVIAFAGLFAAPSFCVWLTVETAKALPKSWLGRVGFWTVTLVGWFTLLLILQGRWESQEGERWNLILAFGVAGVLAVWLGIRAQQARSFLTWRVAGEALAGVSVLALAISGYAWIYNAKTQSIAARAEARWIEIGLPMAEFEKTLAPARENAGSEVVREVLREQVSSHFYKDGTRAGNREPAIVGSAARVELNHQISVILTPDKPRSDELNLSTQSMTVIESLAPALDADYRRILAADPPVWATDPHDLFSMNVPNFLGIRRFSQLIAVDAMRRFSVGDQEGAARAIAAGLRLRDGLRQNPTLVSLMIDVAVEALFAQQQVRLPVSENGMQEIAQDLVSVRAEFLRRLQIESWSLLRVASQIERGAFSSPADIAFMAGAPRNGTFLPKWAVQVVSSLPAQRYCVLAALNGAEHAAIHISPAALALPDFGQSLLDAVSAKNPTPMEVNSSRAFMRIHTTMLLREQSELIREARARLAAGLPVESRDSVVLPRLHWELAADAEKNTVATRLVGAPEWVMKNIVTGDNFWVLPLDGSVAWKFRPVARSASR